MLANVREFGIKVAIYHDIGFSEERIPGVLLLRRLINSLCQIPHATLNAVFHLQVRIDDPHVVSSIRIVISTVERARKRQVVLRQHAPRYS